MERFGITEKALRRDLARRRASPGGPGEVSRLARIQLERSAV
jgi:hypothetical protein